MRMAVLFLDICGYSGRPAERDTEQDQILSAFGLFFTEMIRVAEDYGGTVEKNTGDGLMAYYEDGGGDPREDGCKRALASALTMMNTSETILNPLLDRSRTATLDFRIGIDYGNVTLARLGAPRRFNAVVAIGTAANVACKMLRFAGPGEIVIGDLVRPELPVSWQQYVHKLTDDTGWVYRLTQAPYPFYRYTGRWVS